MKKDYLSPELLLYTIKDDVLTFSTGLKGFENEGDWGYEDDFMD